MKNKARYPKVYILAAIAFTVVTFIFLAVCNIVYVNGRQIYRHGFTETNAAYHIRTGSASITSRMQEIRLIAEAQYATANERNQAIKSIMEEKTPEIMEKLEVMKASVRTLRGIEDLTEEDKGNINDIETALEKLETAVTGVLQSGNNPAAAAQNSSGPLTEEERMKLAEETRKKSQGYQETMTAAQKELFNAIDLAMERWDVETEDEMVKSRQFHILSDFMMLAIVLVGAISILLVGFNVKKNEEEILKQKEEAEYQQSKAETAKQKTVDIAYKNLIMDCGNRYALQEYLDGAIKSNDLFFVSKMCLSDYDAIVSMVGYSEMDNYMSEMANRIRDQFGQFGYLYTTAGQDFIFVFNGQIDEQTAMVQTEAMRRVLSNMQSILSIAVSSPILASIAYTGNYNDKLSEGMLAGLQKGCLTSRMTGVIVPA